MAYFGNFNSVNSEFAYKSSFQDLADGTSYNGDFFGMKSDLRPAFSGILGKQLEVQMKATTAAIGGNGSTDKVMVPIYLDPKIIDASRKDTPLTEILPRVSNMGRTADFNKITSKGSMAYFAAENGPLPEGDYTPSRSSVSIKYLYSVGFVTGPAMSMIPGFTLGGFQPSSGSLPGVQSFADVGASNAMQLQINVAARALKELEEDTLINGDASTDALEFSGIIKFMGATNTVDKNTTALTLDDINTAVQYAFEDGGRPNIAICDPATFTDLMKLISAKIGYMQSAIVTSWGFSAIKVNTMVGEVLVIPSRFMSTTSGSKAMYLLQSDVWEVRVLQDMTFEKLAKSNDADKFMLKMYEALICRNEAFNSSITEIA